MVSESKQKIAKVCKLLVKHYGDTVVEKKLLPIDELVLTILSQNTNDVNMYRAFESLKAKYKTWDEVLVTSEEELAKVIYSSGFFRIKAKRIQATLKEIKERTGDLDLSLLEDMSKSDATNWLTSLHGVGPKTAAIVLLFCFGMPTLPVDTHVWRVSKRLGLVPMKTSRERAQILLEEIVPKSCVYSLNHNLVKHGREVCKALKPNCNDCFLNKICDYYEAITTIN
ncbi:MAG: endonuclease III domain-containing protein [Candidatus Thorarchaeota archaeon]|jgi:endonuclease-3